MDVMSELVWMLTDPKNDEEIIETLALEISQKATSSATCAAYPSAALMQTIPYCDDPDGGLEKGVDGSGVPDVSNARKRELLVKLQPYIKEMNVDKETETRAVAVATGCRSSRHNGVHVYTNETTGAVADPHAYSLKYGSFVESRRLERWAQTSASEPAWFASSASGIQASSSSPGPSPLEAVCVGSNDVAHLPPPQQPQPSPATPHCGIEDEDREVLGEFKNGAASSVLVPPTRRQRKTLSPSQIRKFMEEEEDSETLAGQEGALSPPETVKPLSAETQTSTSPRAAPAHEEFELERRAKIDAAEKRLFDDWAAAALRFQEAKAQANNEFELALTAPPR